MKPIHAYRHALARAAIVFRGYAAQHRAKIGVKFEEGTPGAKDTLVKAEANDSHAKFMDDMLGIPVLEDDYQAMVLKLQKPGEAILEQMTPLKIMCLHMAGGAASEGGELFDAIKRWALFDKPLDRANVVEELGDLEFFMDGLRQNLGITREETLVENMGKLGVRYEGHVFSDEATIARADKNPDGSPYVSRASGAGIALGEPRQHADDVERGMPAGFYEDERAAEAEMRYFDKGEGA